MKKTIVNQTNGIVISINEDAQDMCATQIRKNVAFTVALPLNESDELEKWLCSHIPENDPTGYVQVVKEVNNVLKLDIPTDERRWSKTYKKHYAADGKLVYTTEYDAVHYNSSELGKRLASGENEYISIFDDEYQIIVDSNFNMEIWDIPTNVKIFSFPLDTTDKDQMAVLNLFKKEECLKYLRKYKTLHLERVTDSAKRALIMDAARYDFTKDTMKALVDACAKYDNLGLVTTEYNSHAIGLVANVLWTYCGNRWITMWAYDEYGTEVERFSFTQG